MQGPVATLGSMHICPMCSGPVPHVGGPVAKTGAPGATLNGKPIALMGDMCVCVGPPDIIAQGNAGATINGIPIATVGCMTAHGGAITVGEPGAILTTNSPTPTATMPKHKIPFPPINTINKTLAVLTGNSKSLNKAVTNQNKLQEVAPVQQEEDSTEVTFTSTFPTEQLHFMAKKDSLVLFMGTFIKIFGLDIPAKAFEELYDDAQANDAKLTPTIVVKKKISEGSGKACYYSTPELQEIWIAEQVIKDAENDNKLRGELLVMLTEEYGHHLDFLLRNQYAQTLKKDGDRDEGAKYAYKLMYLNPIEQQDQLLGKANIEGRSIDLIWDFKDLHEALKEKVNTERQQQDDNIGDLEFYKAGLIEAHGQYGHGNVEKKALGSLFRNIYTEEKAKRILDTIYLGNWLRDFSQAVDPMIVRPMSNAINAAAQESVTPGSSGINTVDDVKALKDTTNVQYNPKRKDSTDMKMANGVNWKVEPTYTIEKIYPVMLSVEMLTTIVEFAAAKEFVHVKNTTKNDIKDYSGHLKKLREEYIEINTETLGVYRPEEHIDNPMKLGQMDSGTNRNDKKLYDKFVGYISDTHKLHKINKTYGMKNYIRSDSNYTVEGEPFLTAHQYIKKQFSIAGKKNGINNNQCLVAFGAGLHTLEDYFAHSNYTEVALIKHTEELVFPWVDKVTDPTNFTYNYNEIYNGEAYNKKHIILDNPTKIKPSYDRINKLAAYLPIVTGTFGLVDTAASVLPILNKNFFSIEIEPWENTPPDVRTEADILILEVLKDIDKAQATNAKGTNDSIYADYFEQLLQARDFINKYTPEFVQKTTHWITERLKVLFSFAQYFIIKSIAMVLNDAQVLLGKDLDMMEAGTFKIGINPSHTQLAKDDSKHNPMHELSALLAVEAVKKVGEKMLQVWGENASVSEVNAIVDATMTHPTTTTWQEPIIKEWLKKPENRKKVCDACSPSVMIERTFHAIKEIDASLQQIDGLLLNTQLIENITALFTNKDEAEKDAASLKKGIRKVIEKSREQTARIKELHEEWEQKFSPSVNCLEYKKYTIKPKDTLAAIAKKNNTKVAVLKKLNNIVDEHTIISGSVIKVPLKTENHQNETHTHNHH